MMRLCPTPGLRGSPWHFGPARDDPAPRSAVRDRRIGDRAGRGRGAFVLRIVDPAPLLPGVFGFGPTALIGMELLGVTFAVVGALLVIRRPRNAVGWCMVLIGDGYALGGLGAAITASAVADGPAGAATAGLAGWFTVFVTTIGALVFVLGFIFPTGRGHSPAWDRFLRIVAIWFPITSVFVFLIRPGPLHLFATIDNPFGFGPDLRPFLGPNVSQSIAAFSAVGRPPPRGLACSRGTGWPTRSADSN